MRPRLEEAATEQGWYRLTPARMEQLKAKAASEGRKPANFVAKLLNDLLKEEPPQEGA